MDELALQKFHKQKSQAKRRGIEWHLTFEQWRKIWLKSGKYDQRGRKSGQYVMARNRDAGPYAEWNVDIQTCNENLQTAMEVLRSKKARVKTGSCVSLRDGRIDHLDPLQILESLDENALD